MKEFILDKIEDIRNHNNGYSESYMRWKRLYLTKTDGLSMLYGKERKKGKGKIHLSKTTRESFSALSDNELFDAFQIILIQQYKQM